MPTVGGQTALNLAVELADGGVLEKYGVILIGAQLEAIKKAEDRLMFKDAMTRIGLDVPRSALVNNLKDGLDFSVPSWVFRWCCARRLRWADRAAALPSIAKNCWTCWRADSTCRRYMKCCSKRACSGGRNMNSK